VIGKEDDPVGQEQVEIGCLGISFCGFSLYFNDFRVQPDDRLQVVIFC